MVTATGDGRVYSAPANERGEFELIGLPPGKYEVVAEAPPGFQSVLRAVELVDPRGCGRIDLAVKYDGRVIGRVVDVSGRPVPGLPLALDTRTDVSKPGGGTNRVRAFTGRDGTFEFHLVPPGNYVLGTNSVIGPDGRLTFPRAFYPGVIESSAADTVTVAVGEHPRLRDFILPESIKLVTVKGSVVDVEGRPVAKVSMGVMDDSEGPNVIGTGLMTGDDGSFTFSLVDSVRYEIIATQPAGTDVRTRETQSGKALFRASPASGPITIVMKPRTR
jgi:hypothetical protein